MKKTTKKDDIAIFTHNVKYVRTENKLTITEMAKIMGISVNTLKIIESGILPPRLKVDVLFRIQAYFNIPAKYFVDKKL